MIVGVDEVGRGSLAGPLCVGAVAFDHGQTIDGVKDSKLLSRQQRQRLALLIKQHAPAVALGWASSQEIDTVGLTAALRLAASRALAGIMIDHTEIILDGKLPFSDDPRVRTLPKADALVPAVSAASIIAKVARDTYMHLMDVRYARYQFAQHVGYGTALHRSLLQQYGPSPLHRRSFGPVKALLEMAPE